MKKLVGIEGAKQGSMPKKVILPGWDEDEDWEVVLRRPSMYEMMARGLVPNPLLGVVEQMFLGKVGNRKDSSEAEVLKLIAKAALVSPKLEELEAEGVWLTDNQLAGIYAYALGGVLQLEMFRKNISGNAGGNEPAVADGTGEAG